MLRCLPVAAAAATGILVGSAMVATRFVIDQTAPASLALLRYSIGFCCLLPPVLLSSAFDFERRDLLADRVSRDHSVRHSDRTVLITRCNLFRLPVPH